MQEISPDAPDSGAAKSENPKPVFENRQRFLSLALTCVVLAGAAIWSASRLIADHRQRTQTQSDGRVATAWLLGVTYGPNHTLVQGSPVQKWLNERGVSVLGEYRRLTGQYAGDTGSVELWFGYDSLAPGVKELECHRVGMTAFADDLGQPYHGLLDLHGKQIGVYLPGYDHAARQLTCTVHWMPPRQGNPFGKMPGPVSAPMTFTVDLPPVPRVLPSGETLRRAPVTVTKDGVTVTVGDARLNGPHLSPGRISQRDLTFHLDIQGGEIADANVDDSDMRLRSANLLLRRNLAMTRSGQMPPPGTNLAIQQQLQALNQSLARFNRVRRSLNQRIRGLRNPALANVAASGRLFTITDPYGISLVPADETLAPVDPDTDTIPNARPRAWLAPVNAAGRGTDAIRLRFDVQPANATPDAPPVPFDVTIPVQTDDDV